MKQLGQSWKNATGLTIWAELSHDTVAESIGMELSFIKRDSVFTVGYLDDKGLEQICVLLNSKRRKHCRLTFLPGGDPIQQRHFTARTFPNIKGTVRYLLITNDEFDDAEGGMNFSVQLSLKVIPDLIQAMRRWAALWKRGRKKIKK